MRKSTRLIALLMTLLMLVGMMPFATFAVPSSDEHDHDHSYTGESVSSADVADVKAKVEAMGGTLKYFDNFESGLAAGTDFQKLPYGEGAVLTGLVGEITYKSFSGAMAFERNNGNVAVKFSKCNDNSDKAQDTFFSPALGFSGNDFVFGLDYKHGGVGAGTIVLGARYGGSFRSFTVISFDWDGKIVAHCAGKKIIGYANSETFTSVAMRADIAANKMYYYINGALAGEGTLFTDAYLAECTSYNGGTAVTKDNIKLEQFRMFQAAGSSFPETGFYIDNMMIYHKAAGGNLKYIYEDTDASDNAGFVEANGRVHYLFNNSRVSCEKYNVGGVDYYFNTKGEVLAADRISLVDVKQYLDGATASSDTKGKNRGDIYLENGGLYAIKSRGENITTFVNGKATLEDFLESAYMEWNVYTDGIQHDTMLPLYFQFDDSYTLVNGAKKPLAISKEFNFDNKNIAAYTTSGGSRVYNDPKAVDGWTTLTHPSSSVSFDPTRLSITLKELEAKGKTPADVLLNNLEFKQWSAWGISSGGQYRNTVYKADKTTKFLNMDYSIYFTSINLVKYLEPATSIEDMEMTGWVNMINGDKYYFPHWDHKLVKGATVELDGVGYTFDENGKLVGKANGIHTVQFGDVHYYKDGVMQVGNGDSKYVDGDKVYAINASGDYLGTYAAYASAKAYADIERKYERDDYISAIDFNDLAIGKKENQGTHGGFAETSISDAGLGAVRRGTYTEIVKDADGDNALKWNGLSPKVHSYLEFKGFGASTKPANVALSFDIKLGEDWACSGTLLEVIARESGNASVSALSLNNKGYLLFGGTILGSGNELVVAKLSSSEYTNITIVLRTPGLDSNTSKYNAYADIYINGAKIIDNEAFYTGATKMTFLNEFRMFQYSGMAQTSSMYLDDFYLYALADGELPENVDADWTWDGTEGLGQNADGVNFFYGKNGILLRGEKKVGNDTYLFDATNGAGVQGVSGGRYYENGKRDNVSAGLVTKPEGTYYFNADHTVKVDETFVDGVKAYVIDANGLVTTDYVNDAELLFDAGDIRKYNNAGTLQYNAESELLYSMRPSDPLNIMNDSYIDLTNADALRIKMYIPEAFENSKVMFILRRETWYYKLSGDPANQTVEIATEYVTETEMLANGTVTKSGRATINGKASQRYAEYTTKDGVKEYYTFNYTYFQPKSYTQLKDLGSGWVSFDIVLDNYNLSGDRGQMTLADIYTVEWIPSWNSGKDCYISAADANKTIKIESASIVNFGEKDETLDGIVGDYLYDNGTPLTGWQNIGGDFYYLDPVTGKKATGIKYIPNKMPTGVVSFAAVEGLYYDFGESGICNGAVNGIREVEIPVVTDNGIVTQTVSRLFQAGVVASNGFVTNELDNKTYYADPETGALVKDGTVKIDGTIYTFDENGAASELDGWYEDEDTGDVFYSDPVNGLATGLTVIEIEGVSYYFYFDETTNALKKNYWSDEYGMYFGNDGKAASGMLENVVIGGNTNDMMYFVDGVPSSGTIDKDGMRYIFGDDGKLLSTIDLTAAEVVITIKKDGRVDVLRFKPAMGAMFVYPVPNYLDYDVTVYDKELNVVPPVGDTVMIVIDAVTGYTEYTIVYSEKTVSHDWVLKEEFSTPATCMDDGLNVFECSVCGKVKKEVVDKSTATHVFNPFTGVYCDIQGCNHLSCGGWAKAREESCTTAGIRYTYCTVCNKGISYETIAAAHEWDRTTFDVIVEPMCDEEGLAEYKCKNCSEKLVEEFRDENNLYHAGPITTDIIKAPTCVAQGVAKYTCESCGGSWTDTVDIDPTNHAWQKDAKLEDATCYTGKEKWTFYCADCGERKEDVVDIPADKWIHDYDEGVLNPAPTCGDPGLRVYTCKNPACGNIKNEIVPETGLHNWETGEGSYVYNPNDTVFPNHHWYECTVCHAKMDVEEHNITNWVTDPVNGTHTGSCICGYTVNAQPHVYEVDGDGNKVFYIDDDNHWYKCTVCGSELDKEAHAYDDKKDATDHWKECECGKVIDKVAHEYNTPKYDTDYHWNECSCGAFDEKIAHTLTQNFDNTNHWDECDCGYTENVTPHNYVVDGNGNRVYSKDGEYHWFDCTGCEYDDEKEAHNHVGTYDETYHWIECECADKLEVVEHTFEPKFDANEHWNECACGYKKDVAAHDYAVDAYGNRVYSKDGEYHWFDCTGCEYDDEKEAHNHVGTYDDNNHWTECECGDKLDIVEHTFEPKFDANEHWNECACGYKKDVAPHNYAVDADGNRIYTYDSDNHWYACTDCDYVEGTAAHTLELKRDMNQHWYECADCDYETERVNHNITAITEAKDPTCTQGGNSEGSWCADCELIFVPVEYYGQLSHEIINVMVSDAEGHYYACRNCTTKLDFEQHIFDTNWVSNDKEHKRTCLVCNARDPLSGAHNYLGEEYYYNIDDEEGTATTYCNDCGHETEVKVLTWYEKLGMIKVDGKYYYPNPADGVNVTNKLVEFVDGVRFFGADGALVLTVDGVTDDALTIGLTECISFQNARGVIDDAVITLVEGTYCVKKSVIQKNALVVIGIRYYYFDENALMVRDKIVDLEGDGTPDYWFDENGMGYKLTLAEAE